MKQSRLHGLLPMVFFGYIFLYLPIIILIIFSFNNSKLISTWTGFSFKWYGELFF
jgi:putrescine transport system permease protein